MPSHRYRQVDPDLAGLMSCESAVAPSETNEEGSPYTEYREVPSGLAGLLHASESVTSDADIRVQLDHGSSETDISSITLPSEETPPSQIGKRIAELAGLLHASESVTSDADIRVQLDHGSSEADISSITSPSEEAPPSQFGERGAGLAGLLHASESVTSDADIRVQLDHGSSETDISSITGPSDAPPSSFGERGAGLAGLLRLARLLNASESVTGDAAIRVQLDHCSSEADTSSITLPPEAPPSSFGERGGGDQGLVENSNSATSRSANEEPSGLAALLHASLVQLRRISQL